MRGMGCMWQGGMHHRGRGVHGRGMCGWGHVWQGAYMAGVYMAGGICGEGMHAGETAIEAVSTHPTGMHFCYRLSMEFYIFYRFVLKIP